MIYLSFENESIKKAIRRMSYGQIILLFKMTSQLVQQHL